MPEIIRYIKSDTVKSTAWDALKALCGIFEKDPISAVEFVKSIRNSNISITDQIFLDNLQEYLLNLNAYNVEKQAFLEDNMNKLSESLADASPNNEAKYEGDPEKLNEYAKRILKAVDDCGTKQKAIYLANITRALSHKQISKSEYFKFIQCIRQLTEEDLEFLAKHINEYVIKEDEDYIDDFRSVGLLKVKSKFVCKLPSGITVDNYAARRAACSSAIRCS